MEAYPADDSIVFDGGDTSVKDTWTGYISDGDAILAEPEDYITCEMRRMNIKNYDESRENAVMRKRLRIAVFIAVSGGNCFDGFPIF